MSGSVLLGQVQVMEVSFRPLPSQIAHRQIAPQLLDDGGGRAATTTTCGAAAAASGALQTVSSVPALSAAELAEPDLPVLTAGQLSDPAQRQQLWASLSMAAPQQQSSHDDWSRGQTAHSQPQRRRFLVSKKLLPTLLGQPGTAIGADGVAMLGDNAAAAQLPASVLGMLAPEVASQSAAGASAAAAAAFALTTSSNSSSGALAAFSAQLPSAPLSQLVSADAARLRTRSSETAVAPRPVYPEPTAAERAFLDAASTADVETMRRYLDGQGATTATAQPVSPIGGSSGAATSGLLQPALRINIADPRTGASALHLLAALGADEAIRTLLRYAGVQVDFRASNLATALHWAAGNGHASTVTLLLESGADPRARSVTWNHTVFGRGSGQTPAHWAAESGHLECVSVLHAWFPPAAAMLDERMNSPLVVAEKAAQTRVAAFLRKAAEEEYVCVELSLKFSGERLITPPTTTTTAGNASSSNNGSARRSSQPQQ
jgi:hypothetical protein